jgi:hypothetical protein
MLLRLIGVRELSLYQRYGFFSRLNCAFELGFFDSVEHGFEGCTGFVARGDEFAAG